jgi:hypothetical protein
MFSSSNRPCLIQIAVRTTRSHRIFLYSFMSCGLRTANVIGFLERMRDCNSSIRRSWIYFLWTEALSFDLILWYRRRRGLKKIIIDQFLCEEQLWPVRHFVMKMILCQLVFCNLDFSSRIRVLILSCSSSAPIEKSLSICISQGWKHSASFLLVFGSGFLGELFSSALLPYAIVYVARGQWISRTCTPFIKLLVWSPSFEQGGDCRSATAGKLECRGDRLRPSFYLFSPPLKSLSLRFYILKPWFKSQNLISIGIGHDRFWLFDSSGHFRVNCALLFIDIGWFEYRIMCEISVGMHGQYVAQKGSS